MFGFYTKTLFYKVFKSYDIVPCAKGRVQRAVSKGYCALLAGQTSPYTISRSDSHEHHPSFCFILPRGGCVDVNSKATMVVGSLQSFSHKDLKIDKLYKISHPSYYLKGEIN